MASSAELLAMANDVRDRFAADLDFPVAFARAYSRAVLQDWESGELDWQDRWSREILDAALKLVRAARILDEADSSQDALRCFRRAGEALEWLSRAQDPLNERIPLALLAGACFQIGGLPAMSTSLLSRPELLRGESSIYADFLSGNFQRALRHATSFWSDHLDLTGRDGASHLLAEENGGEEPLGRYLACEVVRSIGLLSWSLWTNDGHERVHSARRKLRAARSFALRYLGMPEALLLELLDVSAGRFVGRSAFAVLSRLAGGSDLSPELDHFARRQFSKGRGILWPSQIAGIDRVAVGDSFALCTPTGSGKTMVALIALLSALLESRPDDEPVPLALYLAPSRALASEVEARIQFELGEHANVTGLYGGTDWGVTDVWLTSDRPTVLVCTVEKAEALLRYAGPWMLARLKIMVIDEAHQVEFQPTVRAREDLLAHEDRASRLESFVARLSSVKPSMRMVALTAVTGASDEIADWVSSADSAVRPPYRSTRQLIGVLEAWPHRHNILLHALNGQPLRLPDGGTPFVPLGFDAMPVPQQTILDSIYAYNDVASLWVAMNVAAGGRTILISVTERIETTAARFVRVLKSRSWKKRGVPEFFDLPAKATAQFQECLDAMRDYCGDDSAEFQLLERGIGVHHGQLPTAVRRRLTKLIENGYLPITLATSTLTEGVNLPFDLIVIPSLTRTRFDPETMRRTVERMTLSEFGNLAGRGGRPGKSKSTEGMTLVALPRRPSTLKSELLDDQRYQIEQLEQQYNGLLRDLLGVAGDAAGVSPLGDLVRLIVEHLRRFNITETSQLESFFEEAAVKALYGPHSVRSVEPVARLASGLDALDHFLLGAIQEFEMSPAVDVAGTQLEAAIGELWRKTFAFASSRHSQRMESLIKIRGKAIVDRHYQDPVERRQLYQFGFAPYRGRHFASLVPNIEAQLRSGEGYGLWGPQERMTHMRTIFEEVAADDIFGMRARDTVESQELLRDWRDVLEWWMNVGSTAPDASSLRAWFRFVADNFEFRVGTAIGAVLANVWWREHADDTEVPNLTAWKDETKLPWSSFWSRELIRWGTLEPLTAYLLARGRIATRQEGEDRKGEFAAWLADEERGDETDALIDPRLMREWESEQFGEEPVRGPSAEDRLKAALSDEFDDGSDRWLDVIPVVSNGVLYWLDPAGYKVAQTEYQESHRPSRLGFWRFFVNPSQAVVRRTRYI